MRPVVAGAPGRPRPAVHEPPLGAGHPAAYPRGVTDPQSELRPRGPRRPRMLPFLLTGVVLGMLAGLAIDLFGPATPVASAGQELIVVALVGALVGGLAGAIAFLVAEWTTLR